MSKEYVMQLEANIQNLKRDNGLLKDIKNKQDKVLEIIYKKKVYIHLLQQCCDAESYNNYFIAKHGLDEFTERLLLTQEEYDLLTRYYNEHFCKW